MVGAPAHGDRRSGAHRVRLAQTGNRREGSAGGSPAFYRRRERRARETGSHCERMRRYTANAAHELRTPLAIMRARLEDAEEPTFKNDLKRDVSQLQAIVEQMLITERLTERQARLDEKVDLATTVRQIVSDYLPLALDCDRKLEFEAEKPPVLINGNRRAMECVVGNLVDNALRAEPPGGAVSIKVAGPDG